MKISRRQANIIRRMVNGEVFWFSGSSPRITVAEEIGICRLGFQVQSEAADGAAGGRRIAYPLDLEKFTSKARELGVIP